jgi:hypoxanthine phosphoribosyltransferase
MLTEGQGVGDHEAMTIQYLSVSWNQYQTVVQKLAAAILDQETKPFDEIVAIARGGLTLGHLLSDFLRIPISTITIQSYTDIQQQGKINITAGLSKNIEGKRILLVDDIADTGNTMICATTYLNEFHPKSITRTTMYYKSHCKITPEYFAKQTDKWILLPSEVTEWIYTFTKKMEAEGKSKAEIQKFLETQGYSDEQIRFVRKHHLQNS